MVFNLIKKDLKLIFADKGYLLIVILMPIILSTILSFALSSTFESSNPISIFKIGVVKEYNSNDSIDKKYLSNDIIDAGILEMLNGDTIFFDNFLDQDEIKNIMTYEVMNLEKGKKLIKEDEISALIILDSNFSKNIILNFISQLKKEVNIKIIKNPQRQVTSEIVSEVISTFNDRLNQLLISKEVLFNIAIENDLKFKADNIKNQISGLMENEEKYEIIYKDEVLNDKNIITAKDYYSAAMLAMFLLFVAGNSSTLLLDEKKKMTYDRMLILGVSKEKILLGKFIVIFLLAIIECLVMIFYSKIVLNVLWGDIITLVILVFLASITIASFGLMLSIISFNANNRKLSSLLNSLIFQIMAAIGGSFIPIEVLPSLMKKLRYLPFNGVILRIILNGLQGLDYQKSLFEFALLLLNSLVFIGISFYLIRKGENKNGKRIKITIN